MYCHWHLNNKSFVDGSPVLEIGITPTDSQDVQNVHYGQLGTLWEITTYDSRRYPMVPAPVLDSPPPLHWCTGSSIFTTTAYSQGTRARIRVHLVESPEVRVLWLCSCSVVITWSSTWFRFADIVSGRVPCTHFLDRVFLQHLQHLLWSWMIYLLCLCYLSLVSWDMRIQRM